MLNKLLKIITLSSLIIVSLSSYNAVLAARIRDYTASEFRQFLRGFGYDITLGDIIFDVESKKAIRQFQKESNLNGTGTLDQDTQNIASDLVINLHSHLNLVMKVDPPLPMNQFFGPRTVAAIKSFQKKYYLPETGIATPEMRNKLEREAQKLLGEKPPEIPKEINDNKNPNQNNFVPTLPTIPKPPKFNNSVPKLPPPPNFRNPLPPRPKLPQ